LTALDLGLDAASVSFCAIDAEGVRLPALSESEVEEFSGQLSRDQLAHRDDCFCCSACVDVMQVAQPLETAFVAVTPPLVPERRQPVLVNSLLRPPQLQD